MNENNISNITIDWANRTLSNQKDSMKPQELKPEPEPWHLNEEQALQKKRACLGHLVDAKPMPFIQLDGWIGQEGDYVFNPDKDGDSIMGGNSYELRHMSNELVVRVFIHADANRKTAIRLFEKQLKWIKRMSKAEFEEMKPSRSRKIGHELQCEDSEQDMPF